MPISRKTMVATLWLTSVTSLAAQGRLTCNNGEPELSLGIADLTCVQCTVHTGSSAWVEYGAEPTVRRLSNASPLRVGDVLVSIDGAYITTPTGGRLLAHPDPNKNAIIAVRREGKMVNVAVQPRVGCPGSPARWQFGSNTGTGDTLVLRGGSRRATVGVENAPTQAQPRHFSFSYDSAGRMIINDSVSAQGGNAVRGVLRGGSGGGGALGAGGFSGSGVAQMRARNDSAVAQMSGGVMAGGINGSRFIPLRARADSIDAQGGQSARAVARGGGSGGGIAAMRGRNDSAAAQMSGGVMTGGFSSGRVSPARVRADSIDAQGGQVRELTAGRLVQGGFARGNELARRMDSSAAYNDNVQVARAGGGGFVGVDEPGRATASARAGWFGFGLECNNCSASTTPDGHSLWKFSSAPAIAGVEPGSPAELAGLQVGDVLREIDGVSMTWPAGAAKFSNVLPGQKVRLTVLRNGKVRDVVLTAGRRLVKG